ncbi:PRC-barrel domain-containing protein [Bosea sp. TWI1241]|uniref:PRC-barrel domain-containing protein n=1 Tax=Bosea sp. TWI1241 TaxID=3148904 RepID=UPI00320A77CC
MSIRHVARHGLVAGMLVGAIGLALAQTASEPSPANAAEGRPLTVANAPLPASAGPFVAAGVADGMLRGSELTGRAVQNNQEQSVGTVSDVLVTGDGRVGALLLSVGGVMGIGAKTIAISYDAFRPMRASDGAVKLVLDLAPETLQTAPPYKPAPMPTQN